MASGRNQRRRKGQPILVLAMVLAGWGGLRSVFWETPGFIARQGARLSAGHRALPRPAPRRMVPGGGWPIPKLAAPAQGMAAFAWQGAGMGENKALVSALGPAASEADAMPGVADFVPPSEPVAIAQAPVDHAMPRAVAHQMLWMAVMANVPLPAELGAMRARAVPEPAPVTELVVQGRYPQQQGARAPGAARWSGDGWLLVRQGGGRVGAGSAPYGPTYGANQIGAVLRYRLDTEDAHKPSVYVRGFGALNGTGEGEVAFGLSGRLLPQVPVVAMIEGRGSRFMTGATHIRTAASLATEIPPIRLMRGVEAETYVQAGYVGGSAHTPFVDGQMRVEHSIEHNARADVRLGLGVWGGAQEGAGRLDIGPTARVYLSQGHVGMRMAVDWRMRVEGHAAPTSGPALTLSAGF